MTDKILLLLVLIILIWVLAEGRPLFRSTNNEDLRATIQDAGHDLQSAGRNVADSIRGAVQ